LKVEKTSNFKAKERSPDIVQARCIVEPQKEIRGRVLFSSNPIAFLQGVDAEKGTVSEGNHKIFDVPFTNKVLVFPNAVGSSVGAYVIYRLKRNRKAPKAMINQTSDIITASGCALSNIPLLDLPSNSIEIFADADEVTLDPKGVLSIKSRKGISKRD
jgi:predicted aconitase with swiveling domain